MKIVIIGGTGLIGSKTTERLRRQNHEVIAASRPAGTDVSSQEIGEQAGRPIWRPASSSTTTQPPRHPKALFSA